MLGGLGAVAIAAVLHLNCKDLAVSGPGLLAINLVGMGMIGIVVTGANRPGLPRCGGECSSTWGRSATASISTTM